MTNIFSIVTKISLRLHEKLIFILVNAVFNIIYIMRSFSL